MTGNQNLPPAQDSHVQLISAVGTCDPEHMERYVAGGMAMDTSAQDTGWSISLPPLYHDWIPPKLLTRPHAWPTNKGMKNLPKDRKARRRAKNKQARAARKKRK
jgi:hypothetical protein